MNQPSSSSHFSKLDINKEFSFFLQNWRPRQHFAAHSHHPWPDAVIRAHADYAHQSVRRLDRKWGWIFEQVMPQFQQNVAHWLGLSEHRHIAWGANTHELYTRLLSTFAPKARRPIKILSSDEEFHSFTHQTGLLAEAGWAQWTALSTTPWATFCQRLMQELTERPPDVFYLSEIFFSSGRGLGQEQWDEILQACPPSVTVVVDTYHSFFAFPLNWQRWQDRVHLVGGCYKYAQAGEGAGFLHLPHMPSRPALLSGWFSDFGALEAKGAGQQAAAAWPLAGSTFDPSGVLRFNAACQLYRRYQVGAQDIHAYVASLQQAFLQALSQPLQALVMGPRPCGQRHAHFICLQHPQALQWAHWLGEKRDILVDARGHALRIGLGIYHNLGDAVWLAETLNETLDVNLKKTSKKNVLKKNVNP